MTSVFVAPTAWAPACVPFHPYSLNEWSSSCPTSVTKPTLKLPAAEADGAAETALDAAADGAAEVPVDGAALDPAELQAANATAADASRASTARDDEMRMILLRND